MRIPISSLLGTPPLDTLSQPLAVENPTHATGALPQETSPFERYDPLLHAGITRSKGRGKNKKKEVLALAFVKKYIQYAKARQAPALTKGAADHIVEVYSALRNDDLKDNRRRVRILSIRILFAYYLY